MFICLRATYKSYTIDFFSNGRLSTDAVDNSSFCLMPVAGFLSRDVSARVRTEERPG